MTSRRWLLALLLLAAPVTLYFSQRSQAQEEFDRLSEPDRKQLAARFTKEIWPLMQRNGKDGCAGCHTTKHPSMLKLAGDPERDFRKMLKDGFLLLDDSGSMLFAVTTKEKDRHMPPGNRPSWTAAEIQTLRAFVTDLDKKQQKK